jgi:putative ABC transport system ATP-binding protein
VFQRFNLFHHMTALENIVEAPVHVLGLEPAEAAARARALLDRIGLGEKEAAYPSQLSGGQQQRVAIARALINDPVLILADEPTGNLDTKSSAEILSIFHGLHERGRTIIIVTHEPDIANHAARIIHIRDGKVYSDDINPHPVKSTYYDPLVSAD